MMQGKFEKYSKPPGAYPGDLLPTNYNPMNISL